MHAGAVQGCTHQERIDHALLGVEVGARGLRRAGEEATEGLEAAVVPAAGAQAELEGGGGGEGGSRRAGEASRYPQAIPPPPGPPPEAPHM
eukprot:scaffold91766_cov69-Phaeocystis_antarctica.AAC.2